MDHVKSIQIICLNCTMRLKVHWDVYHTHSVSDPVQVLEHLWNGRGAQPSTIRTDGVQRRRITLKRVEVVDGIGIRTGRHGSGKA